ncbi:ERF family protein [Acinetobacter sp. CFCC 10889]|uniref:ERF family protein n=1 Tax=Acinetobacter sp. CFCC 10889 TaxID=1775557 RepID=UPI0013A6D91B|nr:ERF family protein [Acinetobacter sp. CFCC 10889]
MPNNQSQKSQTQIPAIYLAIHAIQAYLAKVGIAKSHSTKSNRPNNKQNSNFQDYNFRSVDDIYNVVTPLLSENNIVCIPDVKSTTVEKLVDSYGKISHHTHIEVEYKFLSIVDESFVTIRMAGEAKDSTDKGSQKALSNAHKYCYIQMFSIPTKGENDIEQQSNAQFYQQQTNHNQNHYQQQNNQQNNRQQRSVNTVTDEQLSQFIEILQIANISFERFLKKRKITRDQITPEMLMEESNNCYKHIEAVEAEKMKTI